MLLLLLLLLLLRPSCVQESAGSAIAAARHGAEESADRAGRLQGATRPPGSSRGDRADRPAAAAVVALLLCCQWPRVVEHHHVLRGMQDVPHIVEQAEYLLVIQAGMVV